jgi:predicted dehydrogenase
LSTVCYNREKQEERDANMKKLRFGIAGPGNIARKFAAAVNNLKNDCELAAVASRELQKAEAFAES